MKIKRVKGAKKIINFYKNSFGIFEPYQVLIDLTFCQAAILGKVLIKEQVPKYFDAKVQLVTTNCVIEEGKLLGPSLSGAVSIAKRFQVRLCGHKKSNSVPATECIKNIIGTNNPNRYFVATQDRELQNHLQTIPGVPVMYLNHNCIVLEKPTTLSSETAQKVQDSRINPSNHEQDVIQKLKGELPESEQKHRRKRKKPGGPNPLSVKKRKTTVDSKAVLSDQKKKRIRKRKKGKLAAHVLQAVTGES